MTPRNALRSLLLIAFTATVAGCSYDGGVDPQATAPQPPPDRYADRYPDRAAAPAASQIIGRPDPYASAEVRRDPRAAPAPQRPGHFTMAYPTGVRESSLILLEVNGPDQVRVGQPFNYEMRVTNLSDSPLHGVSVYEAANDRPIAAAAHDNAREAAHDEAAARDAAAHDTPPRDADRDEPADHPTARRHESATWTVGTLGPRETKSHQIDGVADEVGPLHACFAVTYTPTLCTLVTVVKPELQITKTGPTSALICQDIPYVYSVTNTGSGVATGVRVEDALPEGLATARGDRTVSFTVGDLAAAQTRQQTVPLRATRTGDFTSRATAISGEGESALRAQSREVATTVREPVLAVSVEAPESRYVGEPIDYRIAVRNTGDAPAQHAVLHLSVPNERLADRDLGTIDPGTTRSVPVSIHAPQTGGDLRLTATADAQCARTATGNATVAILTVPALLLEAVDSVDPVRVGNSTVYTITVINQGSGPDTNVKVRATVPAEETYVAGHGASAVTADGQNLTMAAIPTLAPKQTAEWRIEVKGARPGDARFNVELTSDSLTRPATKSESTRVVGDEPRPVPAPAPAADHDRDHDRERTPDRPADHTPDRDQ